MLVKVTTEMLAAVGAKTADEFSANLSTFIADAKSMAEKQVSLESLQASITALEGKLISEDRIRAIVGESTGPSATNAVATWAASDAGKKIIGAESSRIAMESLAAIGTTPAKPSPVSGGGVETSEQKVAALVAQGKFEEAYALDKSAQGEFLTAKSYAAFMRNSNAVRITTKAERN